MRTILILTNLFIFFLIYHFKESNKIYAYVSEKYNLEMFSGNNRYGEEEEFKNKFIFWNNDVTIYCSEVKDMWIDEERGYMYGTLKYYSGWMSKEDKYGNTYELEKKCSGYFILNLNDGEFIDGMTKKDYKKEFKKRKLLYREINFKKYIKRKDKKYDFTKVNTDVKPFFFEGFEKTRMEFEESRKRKLKSIN